MISRKISGVHRSAKISEARAIGQNCPYPDMPEVWARRGPAASTNLVAPTPLFGLVPDGVRRYVPAMKRRSVLFVLALVIAVGGAFAGPVGAIAAHPNAVITWNGIMIGTFATANLPPPVAIRLGAIVQASVFDAVNGIDPQYTSIHVAPAGPQNASRQAAAAGAAYTALVRFFPSQKPALDADLVASLAAMDDESSSEVADGVAWGDAVAGQILSWRAGDGFNSVLPAYVQGTALGDWQPTPGGSG